MPGARSTYRWWLAAQPEPRSGSNASASTLAAKTGGLHTRVLWRGFFLLGYARAHGQLEGGREQQGGLGRTTRPGPRGTTQTAPPKGAELLRSPNRPALAPRPRPTGQSLLPPLRETDRPRPTALVRCKSVNEMSRSRRFASLRTAVLADQSCRFPLLEICWLTCLGTRPPHRR